MNQELVLERVFDVAILAKTRLHIRSVSMHLSKTLQLSGTLVTMQTIALAHRVFFAWKRHKMTRVSSWIRKRVRNDDTPILNFMVL